MKLTLETSYGVYSIEQPGNDQTITDIFSSFVEPLLIATGYHEKSIKDYYEEMVNE